MRNIVALILLSFCMVNCKKETTNLNSKDRLELPASKASIDTTDGNQFIAIIQRDKSEKINLTKSELQIIESLLRESVKKYNIEREIHYNELKSKNPNMKTALDHITIDLKYYRRQYFPQLDENGDKLVGVNCFCSVSENDNWKTKSVQVQDGGKCYFHVTINLTKKKLCFFKRMEKHK